jgi:hypothetical protein
MFGGKNVRRSIPIEIEKLIFESSIYRLRIPKVSQRRFDPLTRLLDGRPKRPLAKPFLQRMPQKDITYLLS